MVLDINWKGNYENMPSINILVDNWHVLTMLYYSYTLSLKQLPHTKKSWILTLDKNQFKIDQRSKDKS